MQNARHETGEAAKFTFHHGLLLRWAIYGFFAIAVVGNILHGAFEMSGHSRIIAALAPVNESVWEHLKLGYLAMIIFSLVEYHSLRLRVKNYFAGKLAAVIALELTILTIFYGYTVVTGKHSLFIDILSYVTGVAVGQYVAWRTFLHASFSRLIRTGALLLFLALGVLFAWFTFYPPHTGLFMDQRTQTHGIPRLGIVVRPLWRIH